MSPEERIERVVEMLEEDAVRLRGAVPWSTVLRVCETNGFNAPQIAEVRRRLIKSEVEIEGDEDSEEGSAMSHPVESRLRSRDCSLIANQAPEIPPAANIRMSDRKSQRAWSDRPDHLAEPRGPSLASLAS